ncbi:citrate lyase subunit alpha [Lawsonibacter celer]|jgi:citrate lyase subunit alpha/citrate CoA-transferase|uniref:citrate lyase subunit alpha n=1 Tax=Lawsonibacter celer TaxID=2986526 RepID=UPI001645D7C1|nr:citrate lyase subunit alpha [Lawsonibacter celer]
MNKLVSSLEEAVRLSGLKDGMTISFHHHLRNGDHVLNLVLDAIAQMGIKDLTINASSIFDVHMPLLDHIKNGVVTGLETAYIGAKIGRELSRGLLPRPIVFRTHGGRPSDIISGRSRIDVAFLAAPTADDHGNFTGKAGKSACGSLGYAFADAEHAGKTVVITDNLVPYPLAGASIRETCVDYVVQVDSIGDPAGIVSGTTQITRSPVRLQIADTAVACIEASGLLEDGFAFQTGAGGISLAVAKGLKDKMLARGVVGSYCMGGITSYIVDMLQAGCFRALVDCQCFDLTAVESIRTDPRHWEVSAAQYASPTAKSCLVDGLDVVVLGATEMDFDFNVNVHTDSKGNIMGGSGGHSDAAAGAKMTMIVAPLLRNRIPLIMPRVTCITTPGNTVDVLVTQYGVAVNPARADLRSRFEAAGLPVKDIRALYQTAIALTGEPTYPQRREGKVLAQVFYRDGSLIDTLYCVE